MLSNQHETVPLIGNEDWFWGVRLVVYTLPSPWRPQRDWRNLDGRFVSSQNLSSGPHLTSTPTVLLWTERQPWTVMLRKWSRTQSRGFRSPFSVYWVVLFPTLETKWYKGRVSKVIWTLFLGVYTVDEIWFYEFFKDLGIFKLWLSNDLNLSKKGAWRDFPR